MEQPKKITKAIFHKYLLLKGNELRWDQYALCKDLDDHEKAYIVEHEADLEEKYGFVVSKEQFDAFMEHVVAEEMGEKKYMRKFKVEREELDYIRAHSLELAKKFNETFEIPDYGESGLYDNSYVCAVDNCLNSLKRDVYSNRYDLLDDVSERKAIPTIKLNKLLREYQALSSKYIADSSELFEKMRVYFEQCENEDNEMPVAKRAKVSEEE